MHSNKYTFMYSIGLSILTAIVLVLTSETLKPKQEFNLALDQKTNILKSLLIDGKSAQEIEKIYTSQIEEIVVNGDGEVIDGEKPTGIVMKEEVAKPVKDRKLPVYIFKNTDGSKNYVVPLYGVGLWGPVWGYLSFEKDLNTVKGAYFDHKGETPGLGAEIAEKPFQSQFIGKKIKDANNTFVSINVIKTTAKVTFGPEHRVDAISGGTLTSDGTNNMIKNGVEGYLKYFEKIKE
ncbi:MAG: NADH:ubiquinone reductase (Na(+)-transporting) subunit C [Cytophagaceae bacterium]|nr:NADH:ubiquinone reductase (Na(+)-transporting) subunit C [Cytophagaceae bacterium]MBK9510009.1 NADH:ubiquinone reductase (Na(+)-transporting) subunit C [Cytophagaceae bacterium]MBK9933571.1 NADH:ubiquinone reductase (Na(+)-transporting) subunit C [Cytophagaceae bacterium]MBL0302716.1 NADH:ubiquinone reductase (Na(+)-transporting) subunit C [Cytophagaceae bacterium]MBL0325539.1 NADH:ubiquinone reductase (Na(+)-transporting) subunit C [Cytophagaceae bacterium]